MTEAENQATAVLLIGGILAYFIISYTLDARRKPGSGRMTFLQRSFAAILFGASAPIFGSEIYNSASVIQNYLSSPGSWTVDAARFSDSALRTRSLLAVVSTVALVFSIERLWSSYDG